MTTDERVTTFVHILVKASKRQRKEPPPKNLVEHTRYCLDTLLQKQESLHTALQVLGRQVWPDLVKGLQRDKQDNDENKNTLVISKTDLPQVLAHVFTQLLRLHDSLILLVSGECRHHGDIQAPKPFPTRLTHNATRNDGYTQLYKATSVYSGASSDEWFDTRNGLQTAWRQWFGTAVWDRVLEEQPALEALLNTIETELQQLQQEFTAVTTRLTHQLQRVLAARYGYTVKLSLADQMEKFTVGPWTWERRGKHFQWKHPLGILPCGWTKAQWRDSLQWVPPTHHPKQQPQPKKRRRRVIADEDEDEEEKDGNNHTDNIQKKKSATITILPKGRIKPAPTQQQQAKENHAQPMAEGLKVIVAQAASKHHKSPPEDSLDAIKSKMGVNAQALEQAREGLEREEDGTQTSANAIDQAPTDYYYQANNDTAATKKDLEMERRTSIQRVRGLWRQLQKMVHRQEADKYDIWDARECLRQALMEAGNLHLWADAGNSNSHNDSNDDRQNLLHKADEYFGYADQMVRTQKELQRRMVAESTATEELKMCGRNLLLLQAQALVNRGIVRVELGQRKALPDAVTFFEESERECRDLRKAAEEDRSNGASALETTLDIINAGETEILSIRWRAEAVWKLGRKTEAVSLFTRAGNYHNQGFGENLPLKDDEEVFRTFLTACTESYNAWVRLIDLLSLDIQRIVNVLQSQEKWEWIGDNIKVAFAGAIASSLVIHREAKRLRSGPQSLLVDVMNAEELQSAEQKVLENLANRRDTARKSLLDKAAPQQYERSDVGSLGPFESTTASNWLLTGKEESRRRKRKRYGAGYSNIRVPHFQDEAPAPRTTKQKFRPWGDDLFPKKRDKNGNLVPDFPFPFCAPEMPDAIRAVLERNGKLQK